MSSYFKRMAQLARISSAPPYRPRTPAKPPKAEINRVPQAAPAAPKPPLSTQPPPSTQPPLSNQQPVATKPPAVPSQSEVETTKALPHNRRDLPDETPGKPSPQPFARSVTIDHATTKPLEPPPLRESEQTKAQQQLDAAEMDLPSVNSFLKPPTIPAFAREAEPDGAATPRLAPGPQRLQELTQPADNSPALVQQSVPSTVPQGNVAMPPRLPDLIKPSVAAAEIRATTSSEASPVPQPPRQPALAERFEAVHFPGSEDRPLAPRPSPQEVKVTIGTVTLSMDPDPPAAQQPTPPPRPAPAPRTDGIWSGRRDLSRSYIGRI